MLIIHSFLLLNDFPSYGIPHYMYPFGGAFKLLPHFGYCGLSCCEHSGTSSCAGICFHISWVYTGSVVAKSCGDSTFKFLRNSQTVFQIIVQSHQQNVRVLISPHSHQYLSVVFILSILMSIL